jgi:dUTP pyrophosphatase
MERTIEIKVVNPLLRRFGLPAYATGGAAAMDLVACIGKTVVLEAGCNGLFGTGLAVNIQDPALAALVASRSGLALRHQVRVSQGLGVVDSDYHGEIGVILQNDGSRSYSVEPGERIAQLLFVPVIQVALAEVQEFSIQTERGAGGFGHTGRFTK